MHAGAGRDGGPAAVQGTEQEEAPVLEMENSSFPC